MDNNDYLKVLKYFPPVNPNIDNLLVEAENTYTMYNAISPLKPTPKGEFYSVEILKNLQILRNLLNSQISRERFVYELSKLVSAWGPGGVYDKNILNVSLIELINKIILKEQKQLEIIQESQQIALEHQMNELEKDLSDITFKNVSYKKVNVKDLDFSKLNIKKLIKKKGNKKK